MSVTIQATGLVKRFGSTVALAGVDVAARTGSVFGLLGPNGAGKTTIVRILATLVRAAGSRISIGRSAPMTTMTVPRPMNPVRALRHGLTLTWRSLVKTRRWPSRASPQVATRSVPVVLAGTQQLVRLDGMGWCRRRLSWSLTSRSLAPHPFLGP